MAERTRDEAFEIAFEQLPLPSNHPNVKIIICVPAIDLRRIPLTRKYDPNATIKIFEFHFRKQYLGGICIGWESW